MQDAREHRDCARQGNAPTKNKSWIVAGILTQDRQSASPLAVGKWYCIVITTRRRDAETQRSRDQVQGQCQYQYRSALALLCSRTAVAAGLWPVCLPACLLWFSLVTLASQSSPRHAPHTVCASSSTLLFPKFSKSPSRCMAKYPDAQMPMLLIESLVLGDCSGPIVRPSMSFLSPHATSKSQVPSRRTCSPAALLIEPGTSA